MEGGSEQGRNADMEVAPMEDEGNCDMASSQDFVTGVIEGFYNRPWTQNQRVDLYKKLNTFGLNAYLYAPKGKFPLNDICPVRWKF